MFWFHCSERKEAGSGKESTQTSTKKRQPFVGLTEKVKVKRRNKGDSTGESSIPLTYILSHTHNCQV